MKPFFANERNFLRALVISPRAFVTRASSSKKDEVLESLPPFVKRVFAFEG